MHSPRRPSADQDAKVRNPLLIPDGISQACLSPFAILTGTALAPLSRCIPIHHFDFLARKDFIMLIRMVIFYHPRQTGSTERSVAGLIRYQDHDDKKPKNQPTWKKSTRMYTIKLTTTCIMRKEIYGGSPPTFCTC